MTGAKQFAYFATANDTCTSGGDRARLHAVIIGDGAASAVVTVYNGDAATDPTVAVIDASSDREVLFHGVDLPAGLFVKLTGGNAKTTVIWG